MPYIHLGAADTTALALQGILKNLGYFPHTVDGVVGPKTMRAILGLARDSLTDFAGSINAGGGSSDERQIAQGYFHGVQDKLNAAQAGGEFSGDFAALLKAQEKLKEGWTRWNRAGGRFPTTRASSFMSLTLLRPTLGPGSQKPGSQDVTKPPASDVTPPGNEIPGGSASATYFGMSPLMLAGVGLAVSALVLALVSNKEEKAAV